MSEPLLSVRHLTTEFILPQRGGPATVARALEDVSFDILPGHTVGLVGESGCGKTTLLMSAMRLLPSNGRITAGHRQPGAQQEGYVEQTAVRRRAGPDHGWEQRGQ